jgi:hypothetical protein
MRQVLLYPLLAAASSASHLDKYMLPIVSSQALGMSASSHPRNMVWAMFRHPSLVGLCAFCLRDANGDHRMPDLSSTLLP